MTVEAASSAHDALGEVALLRLLRARVAADDALVEVRRRRGRLELALERVGEVARLDLAAGRVLDPLADLEDVVLAVVARPGDLLREVGDELRALRAGHAPVVEEAVGGHGQHLPVAVVVERRVDRRAGPVPQHRERAAAVLLLLGLGGRRGLVGAVAGAAAAARDQGGEAEPRQGRHRYVMDPSARCHAARSPSPRAGATAPLACPPDAARATARATGRAPARPPGRSARRSPPTGPGSPSGGWRAPTSRRSRRRCGARVAGERGLREAWGERVGADPAQRVGGAAAVCRRGRRRAPPRAARASRCACSCG